MPVYELREFIEQSFGNLTVPTKDNIISHECDECEELGKRFTGKKWKSIDKKTVEWAYDKLPLFTKRAFIYYLPAFLLYSLDSADSDVCQFTFYALTPIGKDTSFWIPNFELFTKKQKECCFHFLTWLKRQPDYAEFKADQDAIANALHSFWT